MIKTVAFADLVAVIPERPEKQLSAWSKNLAATSRVTTNLFNRVRPTSAGANHAHSGDERDTAALQGRFVVGAAEGIYPSGFGASHAGASPTPPPPLERSGSSQQTLSTVSSGKETSSNGTEEVLAAAARDLHARAKKFQKAIPRLGNRWAAPFLSNSHSTTTTAAEGAPPSSAAPHLSIDTKALSPAISPPVTPEQVQLASGAPLGNKLFANALHSHIHGHGHSASLPAVSFPPTPPQHDGPFLSGRPEKGTSPPALARALSAQEVNDIGMSNGNLRPALLKSCLKPPSSMFFAELAVFVRMDAGTPEEETMKRPNAPVDTAETAHAAAHIIPQAPVVRGMSTDRTWHRTEGPPVISNLVARAAAGGAIGMSRSPGPEARPGDGAPKMQTSTSAPAMTSVPLAMPVPRPAQQLHVPFQDPQRTHSPGFSSEGHQQRPGASTTGATPPVSTDQASAAPQFTDYSGTHVPLKPECSCKECSTQIMNGLSSSYTPSWTQTARNKYLADRAQERKVREQGMDAEMRLALRGMQEATMKWLEGRDIQEVTDAELAELNADDLISGLLDVHIEEDEEDEEDPPGARTSTNASDPVAAASQGTSSLAPPSVPTRHSSISPKPSFSSQRTLDPAASHPWPSQSSEPHTASSSGSCTPISGAGSTRQASMARLEYGRRASAHSRTASQEFPPPSPSAAATALLSNSAAAGLITSADEDPELKAALATPPLSRRTSFGSATFRALNRRASLESLRDAKHRHSSASLHLQEEEDTEVEDNDSDDDFGSVETNPIVVVEDPDMGPLMSVLDKKKALPALPASASTADMSTESSTSTIAATATPLQHWALQPGTQSAALATTAGAGKKADDLKLSVPTGGSDEDEENISTPVMSEFTSGGEGPDGRPAPDSTNPIKRASWAPDFVMRGLIREREHERTNSDASMTRATSLSHGARAGAEEADDAVPVSWDRRPSDGQVSEASVYFDARQSSVGHGTTNRQGARPLSFAGPTEGLRISAISENAPSLNGINGGLRDALASAPTSGANSAATSRAQSPQLQKLTLADRRQQRHTSTPVLLNHAEDAVPPSSRAPLTIDLIPTAARAAKRSKNIAPDDDERSSHGGHGQNGQAASAATSSSGHVISRPGSFYLQHTSQTVHPAALAQVVRHGAPGTMQSQQVIGLAANVAGWSVESLPIPSSGGNSRSASVESLHAKPAAVLVSTNGSQPLSPSEDQMEELRSPMTRKPDHAWTSTKAAGTNKERSVSPESIRSGGAGASGLGLGRRMKDLFGNSRRTGPKTPTFANGLTSPLGYGASKFDGRRSDAETSDAENDTTTTTTLPSPITPGGTRFRAFDKLSSAVRRGRQSTIETGSSSGSTPSTPQTTAPPLDMRVSADGFAPMSKVRSAEPFAGFPKMAPRNASGPAVPTVASVVKEKEAASAAAPPPKEGGGWRPRLGRNLSTDAIRDVLNGVKESASSGGTGNAAGASSNHADKFNNISNTSATTNHSNAGNNNNNNNGGGGGASKRTSFAGAFLATLSQTGGGVGGVPLPSGANPMYRHNVSGQAAQHRARLDRNDRRPGTVDGPGAGMSGQSHPNGTPRNKSTDRFQHRHVQSQGTFY